MELIGDEYRVAAIWKKCDGSSDTWCRNRLVRSFHTTTQNNDWGAIQNTINGMNGFVY